MFNIGLNKSFMLKIKKIMMILMMIKDKTKMNNLSIDNSLKSLISLEILKKEKLRYYLNFESEKTKEIVGLIKSEYDYFNLPYKIFNLLVTLSNKISRINIIYQ